MPPSRLPNPPARKHAIAILVAASLLAIALAGGGYRNETGAAAGLLVWWGVAALGLAGALVTPSRAARASAILLAAFAAFTLISLAWGNDAGRGTADASRAIAYLGLFLLVVTTRRPRSEEKWLTGLIGGCAAVALLALTVRLVPVLDPSSAEEIALADGRLGFPIGYWNAIAAMAAIAMAGAVWLGTEGKSASARALGAALIPALCMVVLLTASAGGALAAAVGVIAFFLKSPSRRASIATLLAGAVPGLTACAITLVACDRVLEGASGFSAQHALAIGALGTATVIAWGLRSRADAWMPDIQARGPAAASLVACTAAVVAGAVLTIGWTSGNPSEGPFPTGSGSGRAQFWETGIDAFASAPLAGIGAGGYEAWWTQFGGLAFNTKNAHSLPIETLAELGLIGLALLTAFLAIPLAQGAASRGPAAAGLLAVMASGLVSATIDWTWEIPAAFAPVVISAGALAGETGAAEQAGVTPGVPRTPLGLRVGFSLLCVIGILSCGLTATSNWALTQSRSALADGDLDTAVARADVAADLQPWDAEARFQHGLVAERAGELRAATSHLRVAASKAPVDWRIWVALTRVALKEGNVALAFDALTRARELNPRDPVLFEGTRR